jgi:diguanylate cyclase (GGDEF)-like protein/putative nucleotidyltransferase with HDIG domain
MAIDAKDQITHGHIRRVQQYAVGLAHKLGVTDTSQIKAIEAASLLHDMGKLAVPEYILNKPGRLTPAEFDKMKLHASVGADILSAIPFPYPVVPIVRHHHENWDGSGYPDGLGGADIPIGARILSVVDCFDALTSDRPYRPRLSDAEAIQILVDRRGSMYDPLIVDTFIRVYHHIALAQEPQETEKGGLSAITRGYATVAPLSSGRSLDNIAASTEEMVILYDLARGLSAHLSVREACEVTSRHLRRLIPTATSVFYMYDVDNDELVGKAAFGEHASHFLGLRIPRGQRLSGWVAANQRTILNSDPVLDLGEAARLTEPRLCSCLSTALVIGNNLVGVLTLYSNNRGAFNEDHKRIVEVVSRQVSQTLKSASDSERQHIGALSSPQHLERLTALETSNPSAALSIVFVVVEFGRRYDRAGSDHVLASVANDIKTSLRVADTLFRFGTHEFIVLLVQTEAEDAMSIAGRIAARSQTDGGLPQSAERSDFFLRIGTATAPSDGLTLEALIQTARHRLHPFHNHPPSSIH